MSEFAVGDLVMFANRSQISPIGMEVKEVNENMFDTYLLVDGKWWREGCFITFAEWKARHMENSNAHG